MIRHTGFLPLNEDNLILSFSLITPMELPAASVVKVSLGRSKSGGYSPGLTRGLSALRLGRSRVWPPGRDAVHAGPESMTIKAPMLSTVTPLATLGPTFLKVRLISCSLYNRYHRLLSFRRQRQQTRRMYVMGFMSFCPPEGHHTCNDIAAFSRIFPSLMNTQKEANYTQFQQRTPARQDSPVVRHCIAASRKKRKTVENSQRML